MKKYIALSVLVSVLVPSLAFASVGITLSGPNPAPATQGQGFNEPGFAAFSTVDGDVTSLVTVSGPDTSSAGNSSRTYSVTDSALDSASVTRGVTVSGTGGSLLFCSGPMAPGYQIGVVGGGCGGTSTYVFYGAPLGDGTNCEFFAGCMIED